MKRSVGVTIISAFMIFYGAIWALLFLVFDLLLSRALYHTPDVPGEIFFPPLLFHGTIIIMGGIQLLWVIAGVGVLMLKRWARTLVLINVGIFFLMILSPVLFRLIGSPNLFSLPPGHSVHWVVRLLNWLIPSWVGLVGWYFLRPSVKAQFQKNA